MLNACSKEAPRVRKCYKPMLHLFSFNRTARPAAAAHLVKKRPQEAGFVRTRFFLSPG